MRKELVPGVNIGLPGEFRTDCTEIMRILLDAVVLQGNRLSYVTKVFLPEISSNSLMEFHGRLIKPIPFYEEQTPIQWTTRHVSNLKADIGTNSEVLNIITDINRIQGEIKTADGGSSPFDRIEMVLDINTHQDSTALRFGCNDISPFLSKAQELAGRLTTEARGLIDE